MPRISQRKVVVTGGAGFIGSHLVDSLVAAENRVVVIDDFSSGSERNLEGALRTGLCEIVRGDILDFSLCQRQLADVDYVYHLATRNVRLSLRQPTIVHEVNTTGTLNVLKAAAAAGVKGFLYCSSSEVNGTADVVPQKELYHYKPETIYGASKLTGEYYASVFHRSGWLPVVIARPHNNYGPREHYEGNLGEVIPRFILWSLAGEPMRVHGDGLQTRDFTYVEETAKILHELLETPKAYGMILNVCRGQEVSIKEIGEKIAKCIGGTARLEHIPARPSDVLRLFGDASLLTNTLGYAPKVSIDDGLKKTVDWFKVHVFSDPSHRSKLNDTTWSELRPESWLEQVLQRMPT